MIVGRPVRLRALQARSDLNGMHATVAAAASSSEAAELEQKQRVKVVTAMTEESLSVRLTNVEPIDMQDDVVYSSSDWAVSRQPGCGFTWKALRSLRTGKTLWREEPLLVFRMADHLGDPVMQALQAQIEPFLGMERYPPEALALFQQSAERIAEREFARLSAAKQKRYMSLSDAFSAPPAKTVGGIYKTNSFARDDTEGAVMYEVLSRMNHSCAPNVEKHYEGFTAVVTTLRDVAPGDELCISYLGADVRKSSSQRREVLKEKYNFVCVCTLCEPPC